MDVEPVDDPAIRLGGWSSTNMVKALTGAQGRPAAFAVVVLLAVFHLGLGESYWRPVRPYRV